MADPQRRSVVHAGLTGRPGDVTGTGDLRDMLLSVGGASTRTRSGIDLTTAATKLGVTRRTVERWLRGAGRSPEHNKALVRAARQTATTRAGRRAAMARVRSAISGAQSVRLSVSGNQGPVAQGTTYTRKRTTALHLSQQDAAAMLDAYERRGDAAFQDWATQHWDRNYLDDWSFDSFDSVTIEISDGRTWRDWQ